MLFCPCVRGLWGYRASCRYHDMQRSACVRPCALMVVKIRISGSSRALPVRMNGLPLHINKLLSNSVKPAACAGLGGGLHASTCPEMFRSRMLLAAGQLASPVLNKCTGSLTISCDPC